MIVSIDKRKFQNIFFSPQAPTVSQAPVTEREPEGDPSIRVTDVESEQIKNALQKGLQGATKAAINRGVQEGKEIRYVR